MVEFESQRGPWVANFQRGLAGLDLVSPHPNGHNVVVIASGDLWVVDQETQSAALLQRTVDRLLEVREPSGWILSLQGLALARLGPKGILWRTRRLSWDGFDRLAIEGGEVTGLAWAPTNNQWHPFRVNLATGASAGGSFSDLDTEGWERLAE